jgi:hypothetical protein
VGLLGLAFLLWDLSRFGSMGASPLPQTRLLSPSDLAASHKLGHKGDIIEDLCLCFNCLQGGPCLIYSLLVSRWTSL